MSNATSDVKKLQRKIDSLTKSLEAANAEIEDIKNEFDKKLAMQFRDIEYYKNLAAESRSKTLKKQILLLRQAVRAQMAVRSDTEQDIANVLSSKAMGESFDLAEYVICHKKPKGYLCKNGNVEMIDFSSYGKKWKPLFMKV